VKTSSRRLKPADSITSRTLATKARPDSSGGTWNITRNAIRPIADIPNNDAIFHTVFDLNDRFQIPGAAHWRGIYDDNGRVMVAISYNSGVGDAWEFADDPQYPEKFSGLAIRVGVNDGIYAMTH
jgi:hypothetical protein